MKMVLGNIKEIIQMIHIMGLVNYMTVEEG